MAARGKLLGPPSDTLKILLDDPAEYDFPAAERIVSGLTPTQAVEVPNGVPYSIAQILAHMHANMQFNLALIRAPEPHAQGNPLQNWPAVSEGDWPRLVDQFLSALSTLREIAGGAADLDRVVHAATEREPAWTVGYKLACSVAKHNAYHVGQVVVLRRLIGASA